MRNIARRVMRVRKTHRETLENAQEARAGLTKSTALLSKRRDVVEEYAQLRTQKVSYRLSRPP